MCNNYGLPRWIFILWLTVNGKLYTRRKLIKWGVISFHACPLCGKEDESITHLLFQCVSALVWKKLLVWQGITSDPMCWEEELNWTVQHARDKSIKS